MTVYTEGFDSKCMWYLYGDCILTKYSFYRSALTFIIAISEHISLECHPSIYRHPLYNAKCEFPQRWRYKGGGLYIYQKIISISQKKNIIDKLYDSNK